MRKYICLGMALLMTNLMAVTAAVVNDEMIPTATVVEELDRAEREARVRDFVNSEEARTQLVALGVTPQELTGRLASLSDSELQQMTSQIEMARYGGDGVVALLVVVVLVLLIIFLAKRI